MAQQKGKKNLTQPVEYWEQFQRQAAKEKKTLSEWVGECCVRRLPAAVRQRLPARKSVGRPPS